MQPYALAILDLDGTILDPAGDPRIDPRVVDTVARVQQAGVPVTLATGRTLDYVRPLVRHLGLRLPVVAAQGAMVGRADTGEILHERALTAQTSAQVVAWSRRARHVVALYVHRRGHPLRVMQNRETRDPEYYDQLFGTPRCLVPLGPLAEDERILKFIAVNPPEQPDMMPWLQRRFGPQVHLARTHADLVEGTSPGVDKGSGVAMLLEHLGVPPEKVLFVGDNENDLPVFHLVGTGVAMGTAPDHVKAAATWVAPPMAEAGAAVALERYVLGG